VARGVADELLKALLSPCLFLLRGDKILDEKQAQRDELVRDLKGAKEDIRKREEDIMALKVCLRTAGIIFQGINREMLGLTLCCSYST
jgi:hypothetical protein